MLNAVYLYWFHNETSEENKSLNGHSVEPEMNRGLSYLLPIKICLAVSVLIGIRHVGIRYVGLCLFTYVWLLALKVFTS